MDAVVAESGGKKRSPRVSAPDPASAWRIGGLMLDETAGPNPSHGGQILRRERRQGKKNVFPVQLATGAGLPTVPG